MNKNEYAVENAQLKALLRKCLYTADQLTAARQDVFEICVCNLNMMGSLYEAREIKRLAADELAASQNRRGNL